MLCLITLKHCNGAKELSCCETVQSVLCWVTLKVNGAKELSCCETVQSVLCLVTLKRYNGAKELSCRETVGSFCRGLSTLCIHQQAAVSSGSQNK